MRPPALGFAILGQMMFKKLILLIIYFSLGFCSTKNNQTSSKVTNNDPLCNENILAIFVNNSIDRFLDPNRIDYLATLSNEDLKRFFPEADFVTLKQLSLDLQAMKIGNITDDLRQEVLASIGKEAAIDRSIFENAKKALKQWEIDRDNELKIRTANRLLGVSEDIAFTQRLTREWIGAKLDRFDMFEALKRHLPNAAARAGFFRNSKQGFYFAHAFILREDLIKVWVKDAALAYDAKTFIWRYNGFKNDWDELSEEFSLDILKVFSQYISSDIRVKNIATSDILNRKFIDTLEKATTNWANGPFRIANNPNSEVSGQLGILPLSMLIRSQLFFKDDPSDFFVSLFIRDFFAAPVGAYKKYAINPSANSKLFEQSSAGARRRLAFDITTTEQLSRSVDEIVDTLAEPNQISVLGPESRLSIRSKYLLLAYLGLGGGAIGGTAYGFIELLNDH